MNYDALHTEILCGCEKQYGHGLKEVWEEARDRRRRRCGGEASGCRGSDFTYNVGSPGAVMYSTGTVVIILLTLKVTKRADFKSSLCRENKL